MKWASELTARHNSSHMLGLVIKAINLYNPILLARLGDTIVQLKDIIPQDIVLDRTRSSKKGFRLELIPKIGAGLESNAIDDGITHIELCVRKSPKIIGAVESSCRPVQPRSGETCGE